MRRVWLVAGAAFAVLFPIALWTTDGTGDVEIWRAWTENVRAFGVVAGYAANQADYPPFATVWLGAADVIADLVGISWLSALKSATLAALAFGGFVLYHVNRNGLAAVWFVAVASFNAVGLVYLDALFAPFLLVALHALVRREYPLFSLAFAVAITTKWQALVALPFFAAHIFEFRSLPDALRKTRDRDSLRTLLRAGAPGLTAIIAAVLVFGVAATAHSFGAALTHRYLSGNALNLPMATTWLVRVFSPETYGGPENGVATYVVYERALVGNLTRLPFLAFYAWVGAAYLRSKKTPDALLRYSLAGTLIYFAFNVGAHENHLFLSTLIAWFLYARDERYLGVAAAVSAMDVFNLFLFYGYGGEPILDRSAFGVDLAFLASIAYVAATILLVRRLVAPLDIRDFRTLYADR
jgi:hypothetical protein